MRSAVDNSVRAGLLWERACPRWDRRGLPEKPQRLNREQARSHTGFCRPTNRDTSRTHKG
ncbi:hypothetical protein EU514_00260 [Pseudomonas fragi]|nr:hypothetical protein [Pseudomonas fragi]